MKKSILNVILLLISFTFASCLESNLDELPVYDEAEITSVSAVQYRYYSKEKSPASGEYIIEEFNLDYKVQLDSQKGVVEIEVIKPESFPTEQLTNLSKSNLIVIVTLSTAAKLTPTVDSPKLGVPADWTKPHKYIVSSASGKEKEWTIKVVSLNK